MTTTEKNIKLAEWAGATWEDVPPFQPNPRYTVEENALFKREHPKRILAFRSKSKGELQPGYRGPTPIANPETGDATAGIPDYFSSLDAVHALEERLSDWQAYLGKLWRVTNSGTDVTPVHPQNFLARAFVCATASQRAEALGRTLNLWS